MICTLSTTLHISTQKHLRWHTITKILRNGPRAHFPFKFTIDCMHRSSIQSQALADFIADWTPGAHEEGTSKDTEAWTVFCDGSWGTFGAGAVAVLVAPSKVKTCFAVKLDFSCTNNIVEYEALLLGLRKLRAMAIRRAVLKTDSQVIAGHVDKSSRARDPKLEKYLDAVRRLEASFERFSVKSIPRGEMSMLIC
jgi:ribonuclease HI